VWCDSQPTTIVAAEWGACLLFLDPHTNDLLSANWMERGRIDWSTCGEFETRGEAYPAGTILHPQIAAIVACLNNTPPMLEWLSSREHDTDVHAGPVRTITAITPAATSPTQRRCDCGCPIHTGTPRTDYTHQQCRCAVWCATQPTTIVAREWGCALFLDPRTGEVLNVVGDDSGLLDWGNCGELDDRGDGGFAGRILQAQLAAIIACLNNTPPCADW